MRKENEERGKRKEKSARKWQLLVRKEESAEERQCFGEVKRGAMESSGEFCNVNRVGL